MGAILLREIMEEQFHEIMENFKRASMKNRITFDYDIFIETYIKCDEKIKNKDLTKEQIIQYFWVAFLNNTKNKNKQMSKINMVDVENAAEILDEPYDERRTIVYETIINYVQSNFNEIEFKVWYLHYAENKTYDELTEMGYTNINFHNLFRRINSNLETKLPKQDKKYKTIIKEIFKNIK